MIRSILSSRWPTERLAAASGGYDRADKKLWPWPAEPPGPAASGIGRGPRVAFGVAWLIWSAVDLAGYRLAMIRQAISTSKTRSVVKSLWFPSMAWVSFRLVVVPRPTVAVAVAVGWWWLAIGWPVVARSGPTSNPAGPAERQAGRPGGGRKGIVYPLADWRAGWRVSSASRAAAWVVATSKLGAHRLDSGRAARVPLWRATSQPRPSGSGVKVRMNGAAAWAELARAAALVAAAAAIGGFHFASGGGGSPAARAARRCARLGRRVSVPAAALAAESSS